MSEQITKPQVLSFLKSVAIMSLSATNEDKPLSTILLFAVDNNFNFYFVTRAETYKAKTIINNPKVSLSVWEHKKMLVQVDGVAKQIKNPTEIDNALDIIVAATEPMKDFWPPVVRFKGQGDYVIFKIKPTWVRALNITNNSIRQDETPFTEISI
jgi:general stress protein 26